MATTEQLADLERQLQYSGIKDWHAQGHKGVSPRTKKPIVYWNTEGLTPHGKACTKRVLDANPTAVILQTEFQAVYNNTGSEAFAIHEGIKYTVPDFLEKFRPKIVIRSVGGGDTIGGDESKYWLPLKKKYNLLFFNSAGNYGIDDDGETLSASFPADVAWYSGAVSLVRGRVTRCLYSSIGENIDFMNFTSYLNGTSFASPHTAGEAGLILARYDDNMQDEEIGKFLTMICKDLQTEGFDTYTGHGIPILTNCQKYMTMSIGKTEALVDGVPTTLIAAPELVENRTFVPLRVISENMGYTVNWDKNADNSINVYITGTDFNLKLTTGSRLYYLNGSKLYFDVAPYIKNGSTMLPFRVIAELLGFKVDWLPDEKKVMMMKVVQTR